MTGDDLELLDAVIQAYCQRHVAGGSLHIVLDDGNWDRWSLALCQQRAKEADDPIGEAIATLLLRAPDAVLAECERADWFAGLAAWLRLVPADAR
jgi:hypothetical protein